MLIPVGLEHSAQRFLQVDKNENGETVKKDLLGVLYVPLTDPQRQRRKEWIWGDDINLRPVRQQLYFIFFVDAMAFLSFFFHCIHFIIRL